MVDTRNKKNNFCIKSPKIKHGIVSYTDSHLKLVLAHSLVLSINTTLGRITSKEVLCEPPPIPAVCPVYKFNARLVVSN